MDNGNLMFVIGTIISILGMIFTCSSFQFKSKTVYLIFQSVGTVLFTVSYFFLGAGIGLLINAVFIARNFIFLTINTKEKKANAKIACAVLCFAYIVIYVVYYFFLGKTFEIKDYILGFLPSLGAIPGTIALLETKPNRIRYWKLPDHVCWLIYNISCMSVGGILCEIFDIISNLISVYRFRKVE